METNCPNCLILQSKLDSANKRIESLLAEEEKYEKYIKELCKDHAWELRAVQEK